MGQQGPFPYVTARPLVEVDVIHRKPGPTPRGTAGALVVRSHDVTESQDSIYCSSNHVRITRHVTVDVTVRVVHTSQRVRRGR